MRHVYEDALTVNHWTDHEFQNRRRIEAGDIVKNEDRGTNEEDDNFEEIRQELPSHLSSKCGLRFLEALIPDVPLYTAQPGIDRSTPSGERNDRGGG